MEFHGTPPYSPAFAIFPLPFLLCSLVLGEDDIDVLFKAEHLSFILSIWPVMSLCIYHPLLQKEAFLANMGSDISLIFEFEY